ncbi:MAG: hypothetical protein K2W95_15900 [Candidatus Obscuribacterales bacterium]|nr:hypothetical protein [Candidatus Obscuribacterales bacterium]
MPTKAETLQRIAPPGYLPAREWADLNGVPSQQIAGLLQNDKIAPYRKVGRWFFVPVGAVPTYRLGRKHEQRLDLNQNLSVS